MYTEGGLGSYPRGITVLAQDKYSKKKVLDDETTYHPRVFKIHL